jgi:hypothetical protein
MKKIEEIHSIKIKALLESGTFTYQDIVNAFDHEFTINQIQYHINKNYKDIKKNIKKEYSRGGSKLLFLLRNIFPSNNIKPEFPVGEKLRVDFVITAPYNIAFEYDGSQHGEFTSHFHSSQSDYTDSQRRDSRKEFLLDQRGVSLVRISQLDIDDTFLRKLIAETGYGSGVLASDFEPTPKERRASYEKEKTKIASQKQKDYQASIRKRLREEAKEKKDNQNSLDNPYAEEQKERQRLYRKEQYQRQKQWKKDNKR